MRARKVLVYRGEALIVSCSYCLVKGSGSQKRVPSSGSKKRLLTC